jgi:hypothetical protein
LMECLGNSSAGNSPTTNGDHSKISQEKERKGE